MKGEPLVQEVVHEWEDIVNRVAKIFFEFAVVFYLMSTRDDGKKGTDLQPRTGSCDS